jgi:hypothetical protein
MLGHGDAGGGAEDGGGRGDVEGAEPVAAGADDVENFPRTGFVGSSGGATDLSRRARANAAISSGVSPFCASAVRKSALISAGIFSSASSSTAARTCPSASGCAAASCWTRFLEHAGILGLARPAQTESAWTAGEIFVTCAAVLSQGTKSALFLWQQKKRRRVEMDLFGLIVAAAVTGGVWYFDTEQMMTCLTVSDGDSRARRVDATW